MDRLLRSFVLFLPLAWLLADCASVVCPPGQQLSGDACVCSGTLEPPVDGMCIENDVCDPDGCPCTLDGIEAAIARGGMQVLKCEEGAAPVTPVDTIIIDNDVTLDGQGHLTIQGDNRRLLFEVQAFEVGLIGFTISRGDQGVRVLSGATATLTNSVVTENTSTAAPGGGIRNDGTLTLVGTIVESNVAAVGAGGGIYNGPSAVLTVDDSKVSDNETAAGPGGGIGNDQGTVELLEGSQVTENRTSATVQTYGGGGISSIDGGLAVTDSIVRGNEASGSGGGISITRGIADITRSEVFENKSLRGGGLDCTDADVTVTNSSWLANTSARSGGGIRFSGTGAELMLNNSTVSGNMADPPDVFANVVGGGVEAYGGAAVTIINSTIHENSASSGAGGGLYISDTATMTVRSCTISGNAETGITNKNSLTLTQTIIENGCELGDGATVTSTGHNIESPANTCGLDNATDLPDQTPSQLALADELGDHGGDTLTLLLGDLSVAIDNFLGVCDQPADQRGVMRAQRNGCDIGAVEMRPEDFD